jgi:peptide/nickel transport system permease protein
MASYVIKRILYAIPVLILVTVIVFSLIHLIPGDPIRIMLGINAKPEQIDALKKELNLDKPIVVQYFLWLKNVATGDFGFSIRSKEPVFKLIMQRLPNTLVLAISALIFSVFFSIILGVIAAYKRNTPLDYSAMIIAVLGVSIPSFWMGIMLILVFAMTFRVLPSMGAVGFLKDPVQAIKHLILPALSLGIVLMGYLTRVTRSQMLDVLNQDYIRTARSKGLKENSVIFIHALKNAMIPVVTVIGIQFAFLMGGDVLIEQIFAWPGIGRLALSSIFNRDYPVVQGVVLVSAVIFVFVNLIVDILYRFLNPKVKLK